MLPRPPSYDPTVQVSPASCSVGVYAPQTVQLRPYSPSQPASCSVVCMLPRQSSYDPTVRVSPPAAVWCVCSQTVQLRPYSPNQPASCSVVCMLPDQSSYGPTVRVSPPAAVWCVCSPDSPVTTLPSPSQPASCSVVGMLPRQSSYDPTVQVSPPAAVWCVCSPDSPVTTLQSKSARQLQCGGYASPDSPVTTLQSESARQLQCGVHAPQTVQLRPYSPSQPASCSVVCMLPRQSSYDPTVQVSPPAAVWWVCSPDSPVTTLPVRVSPPAAVWCVCSPDSPVTALQSKSARQLQCGVYAPQTAQLQPYSLSQPARAQPSDSRQTLSTAPAPPPVWTICLSGRTTSYIEAEWECNYANTWHRISMH